MIKVTDETEAKMESQPSERSFEISNKCLEYLTSELKKKI